MARRTEGSRLYTKALISSEAMTKAAKAGLSFRISPFDGEGPEASQVFAREASIILDFISVKGRPDQEEQLLCKYRAADSRMGHCRRDGSPAFGGLHNFPHTYLEDVRGVPYLRAMDEVKVEGLEEKVEKEGLFDIDGNLLAGKRYDSISRHETDLVDDVFLIREGREYGLMLPDGSLIGGENGMQEGEVTLKEFYGEVCYHVQKDGKEKYMTITEGEDLYGGWCTELKEFTIGHEKLGLAKDDEGKRQFRTREGQAVYGGKHLGFHEVMIPHESAGILLQAYDEEGLIILDRGGDNHYGPHHKDKNKKGASMEAIDSEISARFLDEDEEEGLVRYWRFDNTLAYGEIHEKELPAGEKGSEVPFIIMGDGGYSTAKKFRDKGLVGYFAKDPIDNEGHCELFNGWHIRQTDFQPWRGQPYIGFEDREGICYRDWIGNAVFGGYHDKSRVKGVKQLSFLKGNEQGYKEVQEMQTNLELDVKERYAFLEVTEPVSIWRWLGNIFSLKWRRPSNFYSIDGEKFSSIRDIQKRYSIPEDAQLRRVSDSAADWPAISKEEAEAILREERPKVDPGIQALLDAERARREAQAEQAQEPTEEGPTEESPTEEPGPEET